MVVIVEHRGIGWWIVLGILVLALLTVMSSVNYMPQFASVMQELRPDVNQQPIIKSDANNPLVGYWMAEGSGGQTAVITIQPGNKLYIQAPTGNRVYNYEIIGDTMKITDINNGNVFNMNFKVIGNYEALQFDNQVYYRK